MMIYFALVRSELEYVQKNTIFWHITPCSSACHLLSRWFLARLILRPWRWERYVPPKRLLTFNGLHGVISQKIVLFITTAVRTSNPTFSMFCCLESCMITTLIFLSVCKESLQLFATVDSFMISSTTMKIYWKILIRRLYVSGITLMLHF
jgi:hypothetical protein